MKDAKKKLAAICAVAQYIKTQEEAAALIQAQTQDSECQKKEASAFSPFHLNLWGLSGRQQQMQLRTMMQLKVFQGSKRI